MNIHYVYLSKYILLRGYNKFKERITITKRELNNDKFIVDGIYK